MRPRPMRAGDRKAYAPYHAAHEEVGYPPHDGVATNGLGRHGDEIELGRKPERLLNEDKDCDQNSGRETGLHALRQVTHIRLLLKKDAREKCVPTEAPIQRL